MRNRGSEAGPPLSHRSFLRAGMFNSTQRMSIMSQRSSKRKIGSIGGIKAFQRSKKSDNMEESGIKFFPEPKKESETYEVRIDTTENDFKSDLL